MNGALQKCYERLKNVYSINMQFGNNPAVLDVGCGRRGNFLGVPGTAYTGIDHDEKTIMMLQRRGDGDYRVMDARKLDFKDGCFDFIVSTSFFHHLSDEDCRKVCARMLAVLKKDGRIIIADGVYPRSGFNLLGMLIRRCDRGRHVRNTQEMRKVFEAVFFVEKEYYFVEGIFAYYVLALSRI